MADSSPNGTSDQTTGDSQVLTSDALAELRSLLGGPE